MNKVKQKICPCTRGGLPFKPVTSPAGPTIYPKHVGIYRDTRVYTSRHGSLLRTRGGLRNETPGFKKDRRLSALHTSGDQPPDRLTRDTMVLLAPHRRGFTSCFSRTTKPLIIYPVQTGIHPMSGSEDAGPQSLPRTSRGFTGYSTLGISQRAHCPAPAGIHPESTPPKESALRLPRTSGHSPIIGQPVGVQEKVAPHRRGLPHDSTRYLVAREFTRQRGDSPQSSSRTSTDPGLASHRLGFTCTKTQDQTSVLQLPSIVEGSTSGEVREHRQRLDYLAQAGVYQFSRVNHSTWLRLPRTSGDSPLPVTAYFQDDLLAPQGWRFTHRKWMTHHPQRNLPRTGGAANPEG